MDMTDSLQDLAGVINDQLLGDKGLRDIFNVLGGIEMALHFGGTRLDMLRCHGPTLLVDMKNKETGASIRLSGGLPDASVVDVLDYKGSEENIRSMVNDMVTNFRPVKVSLG
jgi:hypothetical protein